jgi:RHS repeat-associated protein
LGTPRAITRASDNAKVWEWKNDDPFGNNPPNEDPANTGTAFKYYNRFPGQYSDQETGTYYNYFRDYDPAIGRFPQSDRIGLRGGINTYAYVENDPLGKIDPDGLQSIPLPLKYDSSWKQITPDQCESKCNNPVTITTRGACSGQDENCEKAMIAAGIWPLSR